jgi:hypothetical protein
MSKNQKSLVVLLKVTSAGIIVLVTLIIVDVLILSLALQSKTSQNPTMLYPGLEMLARFRESFTALYFLSTCTASFLSGYLLKRWGVETGSWVWQSLVSGFIVGASFPFLLIFDKIQVFSFLFVFPHDLLFAKELTFVFYGFFMALMGLLGYYVASRTYRRRILGR